MTARHALPLLLLAACSRADHVTVEPASLRFAAPGRAAKVHATVLDARGKRLPDKLCTWTTSDPRVATVRADRNEAEITSAGPGEARVRCAVGDAAGEVPVTVRVVARVVVRPERATLKVLDVPAPLALEVQALDERGAPLVGRAAVVTCDREDVCRGDGRGQLWAVGAGDAIARVEVDGASATVAVHVVDARTAEGRPRAVTGNPMEEIERKVRERDRAEGKR